MVKLDCLFDWIEKCLARRLVKHTSGYVYKDVSREY
jgi:hypothetical protein